MDVNMMVQDWTEYEIQVLSNPVNETPGRDPHWMPHLLVHDYNEAMNLKDRVGGFAGVRVVMRHTVEVVL